jgi:L-2-hydroxyglutarate oxidase
MEDIPHRQCGKLVVATRESDLPALVTLEERGRANGLCGLTRLTAEELTEYEPFATGVAGLWVAETGVVDYERVTVAYGEKAVQSGAHVQLNARVEGIVHDNGCLLAETAAGEFRARFLVNCAGLQADRVCRLGGDEPGVRIVPFRGEYYDLRPERAELVRGLIYPVPNPDLPFLGVHLSRTVNDQVHAGPNAVFSLAREGYSRHSISAKDVADAITYSGFWRMTRRHWRSGAAELRRSLSKKRFVHSIRELVPSIRGEDVFRGGSGIRAQAIDADGRLLDDFHFVRSARALHVLNAPSPAATASIAIGRVIADTVLEALA